MARGSGRARATWAMACWRVSSLYWTDAGHSLVNRSPKHTTLKKQSGGSERKKSCGCETGSLQHLLACMAAMACHVRLPLMEPDWSIRNTSSHGTSSISMCGASVSRLAAVPSGPTCRVWAIAQSQRVTSTNSRGSCGAAVRTSSTKSFARKKMGSPSAAVAPWPLSTALPPSAPINAAARARDGMCWRRDFDHTGAHRALHSDGQAQRHEARAECGHGVGRAAWMVPRRGVRRQHIRHGVAVNLQVRHQPGRCRRRGSMHVPTGW